MQAAANNYYVAANGNDDLDGRSRNTAWRSIAKINSFYFQPGDSLFFKGGDVFNGSLSFKANKKTLTRFCISNFDTGNAIIQSEKASAITLVNSSEITLKNLTLAGSGYKITSRSVSGIEFKCAAATNTLSNILVDNIDASGYGGYGIYFNVTDSVFGFKHVRITNARLHQNGMAGFFITGSWDAGKSLIRYINADIYVGHSIAYNNPGKADFASNWSGSGILIAGTEKGLIEYCEAYENGAENAYKGGGPVGIWTDDSKYVTIQYCTSHHNKGGTGKKDGGGFDIDGGSYGCVIQYCNSYENEGAGYGLFQWKTGNAWSNDTLRYNTSTNDGINPSYGSITCWGASPAHKVTNAQVYGNNINLEKKGKALGFQGNNVSRIHVYNNQVCLKGKAIFHQPLPADVSVHDNKLACGPVPVTPADSVPVVPVNTDTIPPVTDTIPSVTDTLPGTTDTAVIIPTDTLAPTGPGHADGLITMLVYPNPAHGTLNMAFSNMEAGIYNVKLFGINGVAAYSGRIVISGKKELHQVALGYMQTGIYLVQVAGEKRQLLARVFIN